MSVVITGAGHVALGPDDEARTVDPRPWLTRRKSRKYMGPQDDLAVVAAGRALEAAGLAGQSLGERCGLYLVVGYIPFEESVIADMVDGATDGEGRFDMGVFSRKGLMSVSPLMAFRVLPNMPAYHISVNFDLQGPYAVGYPGPGQFYVALEEAVRALQEGRIDRALVGGVAHQRNFLVAHQLSRLGEPVDRLGDGAGILVLERGTSGRARLEELELGYAPHDPFETACPPAERWNGPRPGPGMLGAATLPVWLSRQIRRGDTGRASHQVAARDGLSGRSAWWLGPSPQTGAVVRPSPPSSHRVVITGMGAVSPLGPDVASLRDGLLAGRSGLGPIRSFDPGHLASRIAGEAALPQSEIGLRDRKIVFAFRAAAEAMGAAGTPVAGLSGVCLGLGLELFSMEDMVAFRRDRAVPEGRAERITFLQTTSDLCLHLISQRHGLSGPPMAHVSACAAGADAIGAAFHAVRSGHRRWMLAGGTDSMVNPLGVGGFCLLGATSKDNETPTRASRPFDRTRNGFVIGEGAGVLVLERLEDARSRGAHIHGELLGYGCSFDAYNITSPHPEGRGAVQAIRRALADAGLGPEAIDAVSAHGTSTRLNDPIESAALEQVLGERAPSVPVFASKSMLGHLISAAGAVEAVGAIACMEAGQLHPTINLTEPDPACRLDYVVDGARAFDGDVILSCSFGFGGQNAALLFGRCRDVEG